MLSSVKQRVPSFFFLFIELLARLQTCMMKIITGCVTCGLNAHTRLHLGVCRLYPACHSINIKLAASRALHLIHQCLPTPVNLSHTRRAQTHSQQMQAFHHSTLWRKLKTESLDNKDKAPKTTQQNER